MYLIDRSARACVIAGQAVGARPSIGAGFLQVA